MSAATFKCIIGLGNPGRTYDRTRHNVGFGFIERCAMRHHVQIIQRVVSRGGGRPVSVHGDYRDGERTVRLLMPLTMMNESGAALAHLDVPRDQLLVVCDDVNLPLGRLRIRASGSAGGHRGLESCLAALGTDAVPRLRLGVGQEPLPAQLTDFVLSKFLEEEWLRVEQTIETAMDAADAWVREGIDAAMNRYNSEDSV